MAGTIRRGDVVVVALDPTVRSEIRKSRPCVVISNDIANEVSPQVTVVPVTEFDSRKARFPVCVEISAGEGGLRKASVAICSQIRTIDKARLHGPVLGRLPLERLRQVERAVKIHLALP